MKKSEYSDELVAVVKQFLDGDDWDYVFHDDTGIFEFNLRLGGKLKQLRYKITVREAQILVYGVCPIGADNEDSEMMARMAEFICRANYNLRNGCFEFDFRDGEVRFKSFIDCDELVPSVNVIKNSIYCTAAMHKRYEAGLLSILFSDCSAKDAVDICE